MDVTFLGGASGVGASCVRVDLDAEHTVLVDAGIRMGSGDRLPDLAGLHDAPVRAIVITHAHADHIGALPLVVSHFGGVPIYASLATMRLMEVMLADSVRVMSRQAAEGGDLPLYTPQQVAATLHALRPLPVGEAVTIPEIPDLVISTAPAGHIAGAISVGLTYPSGRVLISGDLSLTPQRTVAGASRPPLLHPDLLILEATYGTQLHPNRQIEEQRLVAAVQAVIARGGICLIPAFALGRAQEIILILQHAQRYGGLDAVPVYVDGLVRAICATYQAVPQALEAKLARQVLRRGDPFFVDNVQAVQTPAQREKILLGGPAVIIASSGMVTGGPSAFYAARLAAAERHAILLTGYQDDEAPGRQLLRLAELPADAPGRMLRVGEQSVPLRCGVGLYRLSAHADGGELAAWALHAKPRAVALVHGEQEARAALAARLRDATTVSLPQDGDTLPVTRRGRAADDLRATVPLPTLPHGIGAEQVPGDQTLAQIWRALTIPVRVCDVVSSTELVRVWWGAAAPSDASDTLTALLDVPQPYFAVLSGAPSLWRVATAAQIGAATRPVPAVEPPRKLVYADSSALQAQIQAAIADGELYRISIEPRSGATTLHFFFPAVAALRHAAALEVLRATLPVPLVISPKVHQDQLQVLARALLPEGMQAVRAPAVYSDVERVLLRVTGSSTAEALLLAQQTFAERSGWTLEFVADGAALIVPPPPVADATVIDVPPALAVKRRSQDAALQLVRSLLHKSSLRHISARIDCEPPQMVIQFNFPARDQQLYQDVLATLPERTGWEVLIDPRPNQQALIAAAKQALGRAKLVRRGPFRFQWEECVLHLACVGSAAAHAWASAEFTHQTGWRLETQPNADTGVVVGVEEAAQDTERGGMLGT